MPRRILICIEDTGVAHVVAARLMKDGADGVVVASPSDLVAEAKSGLVALAVQDKYPSGEAGASLLRQVRVALGEAMPSLYLLSGDLAQADRSVLAKQYKVREFLSAGASPHQIAGGLLSASAPKPPPPPLDEDEPDIVLHEDEFGNDFDIDLASRADMPALGDDEVELDLVDDEFDNPNDAMTVEVSLDALKGLGIGVDDSDIATELPTRRVHDEVTRGNPLMQQAVTRVGEVEASLTPMELSDVPPTQEGEVVPGMTLDSGAMAQLDAAETGLMEFTMPAPGASRDLEFPIDSDDGKPPDQVTEQAEDDDESAALAALGEAGALDSEEFTAVPEILELSADELTPLLQPSPVGGATLIERPAAEEGEEALLEAFNEAFGADDEELTDGAVGSHASPSAEEKLAKSIRDGPPSRSPASSASPPSSSPASGASGASPPSIDVAASGTSAPPSNDSTDSKSASASDKEDEMQIQQLKKALLAKKRELEAATKRIDSLEDKLAALPGADESALGDGMPAEGVFEDIRYPTLLARARADAWTGTLKMQLPGDITRTIFIRKGLPVAFATSEAGDKIGKVLVATGRINDEQYVKAATRMVERGIKLTEALVDLGLLDKEALEVEIRNLTRDQIVTGFDQTQGRFTTTKDEEPNADIPCFDFGPGEIYVQGFRHNAKTTEMQSHYESLRSKYLQANAKLASYRPKLGLSGDDERLIRLLGEAYTVEEAVERAKVDPTDAARLVSALQALDLVEEWSPGVQQFRSRLTSERTYFMEEISNIREEAAKREKQLFEGFERALAKIGSVMGGSSPSMRSSLDDAKAKSSAAPTSASAKAPASPPTSASAKASSGGAPGSDSAAKTSVISVPAEAKDVVTISGAEAGKAKADANSGASRKLEVKEISPGAPVLTPVETASNGAKNLVLGDPQSLGEPAGPAEAKFHEAIGQAAEDRLDEAEVTLREAVRMDAARPDFLVSLARVLLANPRYERSGTLPVVRSLLDRAVQLSPSSSDANEFHQEIVNEMNAS